MSFLRNLYLLLSGLKIYFFWQKYTSQAKYFFGSLSNRSPWLRHNVKWAPKNSTYVNVKLRHLFWSLWKSVPISRLLTFLFLLSTGLATVKLCEGSLTALLQTLCFTTWQLRLGQPRLLLNLIITLDGMQNLLHKLIDISF